MLLLLNLCMPPVAVDIVVVLQVLPPVEALLDVTAHPEHDIFSMSFGFWHKLSRQLSIASLQQQQQEQQQAPGSPIQPAAVAATSTAAAEQQRRREFFRPAFEKLISLVRSRMRCVWRHDSASLLHALPQTVACHMHTKPPTGSMFAASYMCLRIDSQGLVRTNCTLHTHLQPSRLLGCLF
jgi:hypothetical protein